MSLPQALSTIRRTDLLTLSRARLADRDVVLVTRSPEADARRVSALLSEVAALHARFDHPVIPRVAAFEPAAEEPWLALDCPAVCDATGLVARLAERAAPIHYGAADAFIVSLRDALRHAHARGAFLGRMSPHDILFAGDGRWWLIGLGRNFPLEVRSAPWDPAAPTFQTPELIAGAPPSAITDFVGLLLFMRSVLPYVALPERLARLMRGEFEPADAALAGNLLRFEQEVVSALPGQRLGIDEAIAISNEVRAELGVVLDEDGFRRHAARMLGDMAAPLATAVARDGAFLIGPRGQLRLGRAQRRLLLALKEATARGTGLDVDGCISAGWPDQRLLFESGRNRVYAVIKQLRSAGVPIERFDGGYRLTTPLDVI
ncbi:MAG: hypothetical protein ACOZQL_19065 [Myxococcota bacterium]